MAQEDRLDSWKAIAGYVGRDIRACFRWTKELFFPVHKIDIRSRKSRVFAYKYEIDKWFKKR